VFHLRLGSAYEFAGLVPERNGVGIGVDLRFRGNDVEFSHSIRAAVVATEPRSQWNVVHVQGPSRRLGSRSNGATTSGGVGFNGDRSWHHGCTCIASRAITAASVLDCRGRSAGFAGSGTPDCRPDATWR
jgi:hypothetical protein